VIAPRVIHSSQPQTLYVRATGGRDVRLRIAGGDDLPTDALGDGLFRLDHRPTGPFGATEVSVEITVDGVRTTRRVAAVDPIVRPAWMCSDADAGLVATVSEDTDEVIVLDRGGSLARIAAGDAPTDCAFANGRLLVSHRYDASLRIYDPASRTQTGAVPLGFHQRHVRASARGDRIVVSTDGARRGIFVVDVAGLEAMFFTTEFEPEWVLFGADDASLLVTDRTVPAVRRLVVEDDRLVERGALTLSRPAVTAEMSPDGTRLFLTVTDFRPLGVPSPNHFVEDRILEVDASTFAILRSMPTFQVDGRHGGSP
jgi:hypothetical protein